MADTVTCVEAPGLPTSYASWPLTRDESQSNLERHYFGMVRYSDEYHNLLVKPPAKINFKAEVFTNFNMRENKFYHLNLFNDNVTEDASTEDRFIYTVSWGNKDNPAYVKHWYLSGLDICTIDVKADLDYNLGDPSVVLTQYWD